MAADLVAFDTLFLATQQQHTLVSCSCAQLKHLNVNFAYELSAPQTPDSIEGYSGQRRCEPISRFKAAYVENLGARRRLPR